MNAGHFDISRRWRHTHPESVNVRRQSMSGVRSVASSMNITSVKGVIIDLLNAFCFVTVATLPCLMRPRMGMNKLVFPLLASPTKHGTLSFCFVFYCREADLVNRHRTSPPLAGLGCSLRLLESTLGQDLLQIRRTKMPSVRSFPPVAPQWHRQQSPAG